MAITIRKESRLITLATQNTEYQMKIDEYGVLLHTYYGSRIYGSDMSEAISCRERGFSGNLTVNGEEIRSYSLDVLPQEYSCGGSGDYRVSALRILDSRGGRSCTLRVTGYRTEKGKYAPEGLPHVYDETGEAESLVITMKDPYSALEAELQYGVFEEKDIITRSVRFTNTGSESVRLEKAASLCLDWQYGDFDWLTFYGCHAQECNLQRNSVHHGVQSVGSTRGNSSHHYNPFSVLCEKNTDENSGLCYGFSFVYSGEFLMEVEKDQVSQTRLVLGIHPANFSWKLDPGMSFQTPEAILTCSNEGFGKLSRNMHRIIRDNVCRGEWKYKQRPVLINNWEATYFSFDGAKLISIAEESAKLGIEMLVMDDGWFGKRENDYSGLGDWFPNEKKLGCSLKELGEEIKKRGMKFGIWFEPEGISEDSDLYRAHPEWAVAVPGCPPVLSRNQLVLDVSRKDVQDYIIARMSEVLSSAPISYVKWDMNRSINEKYSASLSAENQGEFAHRFMLGLYRILEELIRAFPHVLFEGCSGGGGRFDAGMLYYTPQIWCSDNTDAINRLTIQYGNSFCYPISAVGSHVSAVPNHQTGRITPLATRGAVAMSGTFGYELDITKLKDEEKEQIRRQIVRFHKYYELIQRGDYYRLTSPKDPCVIWSFVSPDQSNALITVVSKEIIANSAPVHFNVPGLDEKRLYNAVFVLPEADDRPLKVIEKISGAALKNGGLTIPVVQWWEYQAWQVEITEAE
ncbi:MAG: alpha-galactosidase [Solobacterium sp.]|nr:alpha-galactosidase [Solobacterium sp.]